jgi:hypothetical protein
MHACMHALFLSLSLSLSLSHTHTHTHTHTQAGDYVLVPSTSAAVDCDDCDNYATYHCSECILNLCGKCCEDLHSRKSRKHHTVVPLDSSSPTSSKSAQMPTTVQRPEQRGGGASSGPRTGVKAAVATVPQSLPSSSETQREQGRGVGLKRARGTDDAAGGAWGAHEPANVDIFDEASVHIQSYNAALKEGNRRHLPAVIQTVFKW